MTDEINLPEEWKKVLGEDAVKRLMDAVRIDPSIKEEVIRTIQTHESDKKTREQMNKDLEEILRRTNSK